MCLSVHAKLAIIPARHAQTLHKQHVVLVIPSFIEFYSTLLVFVLLDTMIILVQYVQSVLIHVKIVLLVQVQQAFPSVPHVHSHP